MNEQNDNLVKESKGKNKYLLLKQIMIFFLNGMIFWGLALITYGLVVYYKEKTWEILESIADFLSRLLALIGTILVVFSAYYSSNGRRADMHSRYFVAPLIMLLVLFTFFLWFGGKELPAHIFNGFSMIAIACSVLRGLPFSEWDGYDNKKDKSN